MLGMPVPPASTTLTIRAVGRIVPTEALCPFPLASISALGVGTLGFVESPPPQPEATKSNRREPAACLSKRAVPAVCRADYAVAGSAREDGAMTFGAGTCAIAWPHALTAFPLCSPHP